LPSAAGRQVNRYDRAAALGGRDRDVPAVRLDHAAGDRQSQTGAAMLGGEERFERLFPHLGRYAAQFNGTVNVLDGTGTGNFTFTAANGDQLFATFLGLGVGDPIASITETLTITGGTGRFAGASGTLVVRRTLDLTTGVSSGSIDGSITM